MSFSTTITCKHCKKSVRLDEAEIRTNEITGGAYHLKCVIIYDQKEYIRMYGDQTKWNIFI